MDVTDHEQAYHYLNILCMPFMLALQPNTENPYILYNSHFSNIVPGILHGVKDMTKSPLSVELPTQGFFSQLYRLCMYEQKVHLSLCIVL